jgi:hypothetical protein
MMFEAAAAADWVGVDPAGHLDLALVAVAEVAAMVPVALRRRVRRWHRV